MEPRNPRRYSVYRDPDLDPIAWIVEFQDGTTSIRYGRREEVLLQKADGEEVRNIFPRREARLTGIPWMQDGELCCRVKVTANA